MLAFVSPYTVAGIFLLGLLCAHRPYCACVLTSYEVKSPGILIFRGGHTLIFNFLLRCKQLFQSCRPAAAAHHKKKVGPRENLNGLWSNRQKMHLSLLKMETGQKSQHLTDFPWTVRILTIFNANPFFWKIANFSSTTELEFQTEPHSLWRTIIKI